MIEAFDYFILSLIHSFAVITGRLFTPVIRFLSIFADKQYFYPIFIIAVILCLFKKTRKFGVGMIVAMGIGVLLTNVCIKPLVARSRPFQSGNSDYLSWWKYTGALPEDEYSFPSGHTTNMMAAMTALFIYSKSRYKGLFYLPVVLVGFSRNYFVVHYPTDILGGVVIGLVAGILAYYLLRFIAERTRHTWAYPIFEDFDEGVLKWTRL